MSSTAEWWGQRSTSVNLQRNNRNYPIKQSYNRLKSNKKKCFPGILETITEDLLFVLSESQEREKKEVGLKKQSKKQ